MLHRYYLYCCGRCQMLTFTYRHLVELEWMTDRRQIHELTHLCGVVVATKISGRCSAFLCALNRR